MPNHIRNIIRMDGIDKLPLFSKNEWGQNYLDFEKIIPMPESERANWYDWRIKNWGTKWNSYENVVNMDSVEFLTAWSSPIPVITALSKVYPDKGIELIWADEDMGNNTGFIQFSKGEEVLWCYHDSCSQEAFETYIECWGEDEMLQKDEDGLWQIVY